MLHHENDKYARRRVASILSVSPDYTDTYWSRLLISRACQIIHRALRPTPCTRIFLFAAENFPNRAASPSFDFSFYVALASLSSAFVHAASIRRDSPISAATLIENFRIVYNDAGTTATKRGVSRVNPNARSCALAINLSAMNKSHCRSRERLICALHLPRVFARVGALVCARGNDASLRDVARFLHSRIKRGALQINDTKDRRDKVSIVKSLYVAPRH